MRRLFADFADGEYDRPNQRWVCGNSDECGACPFGPSTAGKCPELAECQPVKIGDRWRCNRPATRGGPCEDSDGGPTPDGQCCCVNKCQPRLSMRSRRGRLALGSALLAVGVLALLFGSPWRSDALAPGPLAQPHAQLLARGDWANRCTACHVGQDKSMLTLAIGALAGSSDPNVTQSHLCMECHDKQFDRGSAMLAHGLPMGALENATSDSVACATCHKEHHGALADLTTIGNGRCQACHQQRYHSFADGHPDFAEWPHKRRTRIVFDHAAHRDKHYVQEKQTFDCAKCHVEGPRGQAMLTLNYDAACAACHDKTIAATTGAGLAVLALPTLDLDVLADHGIELADWPAAAQGDFDGDLPAALKLLLAEEPSLSALLDRYGPGFSFYDIDPDSPVDASDAANLAGAIRKLLSELQSEGQQAAFIRLELLVGRKLTPGEQKSLAAGLPIDLVKQAASDWFSDVQSSSYIAPVEQVAQHPAGGWFKNDATLALAYAPTGHADPLLTSWIELVVSLDDTHAALRESALGQLAQATSPGQCLTCHSVERGADGRLLVNWLPRDRSAEARGFTRFGHGAHATIHELADCAACHQIDTTADTSAAYTSTDPHAFASHFQPITKAACAECHQPHSAGDSCTQCHNYHVDSAFER